MQHKYVACDLELCTGCQLCEFACSAEKEGEFNLELSRIRTVRPELAVMMSIACRQCEDPPCVTACPRHALSTNEVNGTILLDRVRCVGCGWCIEVCDFGAIALDSRSKLIVICDLCPDLPQPKCIEICPQKALSLSTAEEVAQRTRDRTVSSECH
ncbi:MAG: 4Fe-4S dicluster domain-containing protein [Chloroflexota bacterium]|nr:4Fe-4S dicluster domain-containing protein [Chloroflexota bacterium]